VTQVVLFVSPKPYWYSEELQKSEVARQPVVARQPAVLVEKVAILQKVMFLLPHKAGKTIVAVFALVRSSLRDVSAK
jgi:hypothetical protein